MYFIADLHIHSHFSRATSKNLQLPFLNKWAQLKGIQVVGTGDFTHPAWLAELKKMLEPAQDGLFKLKDEFRGEPEKEVFATCHSEVRFILSVEISNIYKRNGKVRKVHNIIFMPNLEAAAKFQREMEKIGNIRADGRPILGLDSRNLLDIVLKTDPQGYLIPAHIWTPWFSVLGSNSGFDSILECYDDLTPHIFALETGLSSDPAMNWRLSQLDQFALVSNSDAHSPENLGREANMFDTELSYPAIFEALKSRNPEKFLGTLEFFPEEGKYHLDGHRKCNTCMTPEETIANKGRCPVCGKKVTVGVLSRVIELADRASATKPPDAAPFKSLIPLPEIISELQNVGPKSKNVQAIFYKMLSKIGSELYILTQAPIEEIQKIQHPLLGEAIQRMRAGQIYVEPGYDGEYGKIRVFSPDEKEKLLTQLFFFQKPASSMKTKMPRTNRIADYVAPELTGTLKTSHAPTLETDEPIQHLNKVQLEAVQHTASPLLIVAGPGTGKTRTLTYRIAFLINEKNVNPEQILAITFTRHAAQEMRERFELLLGSEITYKMTICTFHALGHLILQEDIERLGRRTHYALFSPADQEEILQNLLPELTHRERTILTEKISRAKNRLITAENLSQQLEFNFDAEFRRVYELYEHTLRRMNALDYDDLILLPFQLLKRFSDLKEKYQEKFRWISVDEYQDINFAQYQFLMQLVNKETNLCAIGDPNQAIYGFRGADVRYFNHFQQDFPGAKVISLGQNYRSTDLIIKASSQIISQNPNHHHFEIWSEIPGETRIEISQSATEKAEAEFVVHSIEKMLGGTGFFSRDSSRVSAADEENAPRSFSDFAVLYRMKSQLPALGEAFLRSGMPYQTMGETPLFEQPLIKEILSYLKILVNPESDLDLLRIINSPPRGIGEKSIKIISDYCAKKGFSIFEAIERHERMAELNSPVHKALQNFYDQISQLQSHLNQKTVSELIYIILDEIGLHPADSASDENKWLTLFLEQAQSYDKRLNRFLVDHLMRTETDSYDPRAERVSLMTLHAAKGLEFAVVFIVGCEENILPYLKSNYTTEEAEAAIQEERRLFYVGMTRARQQLFLCNARKRLLFGKTNQARPSRFLKDIEETLKKLRTNMPVHKKKTKDDKQLGLFDAE